MPYGLVNRGNKMAFGRSIWYCAITTIFKGKIHIEIFKPNKNKLVCVLGTH